MIDLGSTPSPDYDYEESQPCSTATSLVDHAVMPAIFYLVFALGLIGNTGVVWVLLRFIKVKSMTDVCLLNLALSDLLVVISLPVWALHSKNSYLLTDALCKVIVVIYQIGFYSGILFVVLMSVDRYLAIVHAVAAMGTRTLRSGIIVSAAIWAVSISIAFPEIIFAKAVTEDGSISCSQSYPEMTAWKWKLFRNICENVVCLFISLPLIVFCYARIVLVLLRSKNSKRNRAMKLIGAVVGHFIVFWVPYNTLVFLKTLQEFGFEDNCETSSHIDVALELTEIIALTHCCVNPLIYAFAGEKFRKCLCVCQTSTMKEEQQTSTSIKTSINLIDTSNILYNSP